MDECKRNCKNDWNIIKQHQKASKKNVKVQ